jgi:hypothetical protein
LNPPRGYPKNLKKSSSDFCTISVYPAFSFQYSRLETLTLSNTQSVSSISPSTQVDSLDFACGFQKGKTYKDGPFKTKLSSRAYSFPAGPFSAQFFMLPTTTTCGLEDEVNHQTLEQYFGKRS